MSDKVKNPEFKDTEEQLATALAEAEKVAEKKKSEGIRVFVYGTLKHGHGNHRLLEKATFLGRCYITGTYRLLDLGWYPGLVLDQNTPKSNIFGEVYRITQETLDDLDILEGNGSYYTRTQVQTPWKKAWCYFLPGAYNDRNDLKYLEKGVWKPSDDENLFMKGVVAP